MKFFLYTLPAFLFLCIPFVAEKSSAQTPDITIQNDIQISQLEKFDTYARRGSSSSSRSSFSTRNQTSSSRNNATQKDTKTDSKSSGMSGMVKGLIGGALIGYLLSSIGLGEMFGGFAEIITWILLGLLVFGTIKWFMNRKPKHPNDKFNNTPSQNY